MNPDVIYGRDFEEESMEIEKIDGEIGEVTLRGKVLTCENRELRQKTYEAERILIDGRELPGSQRFCRRRE